MWSEVEDPSIRREGMLATRGKHDNMSLYRRAAVKSSVGQNEMRSRYCVKTAKHVEILSPSVWYSPSFYFTHIIPKRLNVRKSTK